MRNLRVRRGEQGVLAGRKQNCPPPGLASNTDALAEKFLARSAFGPGLNQHQRSDHYPVGEMFGNFIEGCYAAVKHYVFSLPEGGKNVYPVQGPLPVPLFRTLVTDL